jgi:hypothetical protein
MEIRRMEMAPKTAVTGAGHRNSRVIGNLMIASWEG